MADRARRATTAAKSAASSAFQRAQDAAKAARAKTKADMEGIMGELGGPRRSIGETMAPYMAGPAIPGTERARYEALMGKPYPGTGDADETMGQGRRRRKTKKAGRRRKSRNTRRRA